VRRIATRVAGTMMAVAATASIIGLSGLPWTPPGADRSLLRLAWRAVGELVEECRRPTAEENERLPAHMRREQVCEGRTAPFHLRVEVDGRPVIDDTVFSAGARGDRPVYVFRELEIEAGAHSVAVDFITLLPAGGAPVRTGAAAAAPAFPDTLRFEGRVAGEPGRITLLTYDADRRSLVSRSEQPR